MRGGIFLAGLVFFVYLAVAIHGITEKFSFNRVCGFDVADCDIKARAGRSSKTSACFHGARHCDALPAIPNGNHAAPWP